MGEVKGGKVGEVTNIGGDRVIEIVRGKVEGLKEGAIGKRRRDSA